MESILILIIVWMFFCRINHVNGDSCQGAMVLFGTNETIIDTNNQTWTIHSDGKVYVDGQLAGYSGSVIALVYWDKIVYQENQSHGWWGWVSNNWLIISDPDLISNLTAASGCSYAAAALSITKSPDLPLSYFIAQSCNDSNYIGDSCDVPMKPCDALKPCQNWGYCTNNPNLRNGYFCMCSPGFNGTNCEYNFQVCQSNTCLYNGICNTLNRTNFECNCTQGYIGIHCDLLINYCNNVTCLNQGVCRSLPLNYTCECLPTSSGRHCEYVTTKLLIRRYASITVGFIAIIFLCISTGYFISFDILTYVFGIDVTARERVQIRHERTRPKKCQRRSPRKRFCRRCRNKVKPFTI